MRALQAKPAIIAVLVALTLPATTAAQDYEAACRATPDKFEALESVTERDVEICVCSFQYMEKELGPEYPRYASQWMLSDIPFGEITTEITLPELLQVMAEMGPAVEAECGAY